jgi:AcrR family transcriptional regulator
MTATENAATPQTLNPNAEVPENAERIMLAAIRLFGRKGYAATSVREIVQEADVTNPMLYYYFDSKEGLFRQLMGFLFGLMQERIAVIIDDDDLDFPARLCAITRSHLEGVREHPEVLRFIYSAIFGPTESRPDIDVHSMHMKTHDMVEHMFAKAVVDGELTLARPSLTSCECAQLFLGSINQELMRILGLLEMTPDVTDELIEHLTGEPAVERITAFFLGGIGTLPKDVHS